jgi:transposase-like protein
MEGKKPMKRKQYSAQTKFRVSLEAARGYSTLSEIANKYNVHPTQISNWKQHLVKNGASLFENQKSKSGKEADEKEKELYEQIGRLKMELEWLKKNAANIG